MLIVLSSLFSLFSLFLTHCILSESWALLQILLLSSNQVRIEIRVMGHILYWPYTVRVHYYLPTMTLLSCKSFRLRSGRPLGTVFPTSENMKQQVAITAEFLAVILLWQLHCPLIVPTKKKKRRYSGIVECEYCSQTRVISINGQST